MIFRLADHAINIVLAEHGAAGDAHLLLLARRAILRLHVEDAVRVNVERHLNLWHAARSGGDPGEDELAERLVVGGKLALTLQHVDLHLRLVVGGRRERLAL